MAVRVNPASVTAYGNQAQEGFGVIRTSLESLCADMVEVEYYGPNAVQFKTQCGELAAELSEGLLKDITNICGAVRDTTTNIAQSLGGSPVAIDFNSTPITPPPVPQGDDSVGVNLEALEAMKGTANSHCTTISDQFTNHLTALQNTDWEGNAKTNAVEAVSRFTTTAQGRIEETSSQLGTYIDEQITNTRTADQ